MSATIEDAQPVARKTHRCCWCGEAIIVGEKYNRWRGIFEGQIQTTKMHLECLEAWHSLDMFEMEEGFDLYVSPRGGVL